MTQIERYTMFLDWKNQYCQNDCTTQDNLHFQCNSFQITHGIFFPTELEQKKDLKICENVRNKTAIVSLKQWLSIRDGFACRGHFTMSGGIYGCEDLG